MASAIHERSILSDVSFISSHLLTIIFTYNIFVLPEWSQPNTLQVTKEDASEGCTRYAQGGVSAVLAELDTVEDHIRDTLVAGDFLNTKQ